MIGLKDNCSKVETPKEEPFIIYGKISLSGYASSYGDVLDIDAIELPDLEQVNCELIHNLDESRVIGQVTKIERVGNSLFATASIPNLTLQPSDFDTMHAHYSIVGTIDEGEGSLKNKSKINAISLNTKWKVKDSYVKALNKEAIEPNCENCLSNCCKCFTLRHNSPERLARMDSEDARFALKNFIYLGEFLHNPIFPQRTIPARHAQDQLQHFYTCRLIGNDGKCMDYENRPPLCKGYGVDYNPDLDCLFYPAWKEAQLKAELAD